MHLLRFFPVSASKQIKFTPSADTNKKSSFVKKSALLTSGADFRFNFTDPAGGNNNNQDNVQQPVDLPVTTSTSSLNSSISIFGSTGGSQFKFNFAIDNTADDIDMAGLKLK